MGCVYSNWEGECSMFEEGTLCHPTGCDKDGDCWCEENPDPSYSCDSYEFDGNGEFGDDEDGFDDWDSD
mgnify:CR=1 FL=1